MKQIFNWISRKTNKKQPELSKNTAEGADHSQEQQQQQQQQLHSHNPTLQASGFHQADAELKFNRSKPTFSFSGLQDAVVVKEDMQKRHEILKIFLKHEEYGLLAIGTFGYGTSSNIEPEIELFEVKPSALLQPEEVKVADQEQSSTSQATTNEHVEKEHAVVLHRDRDKKMSPLDGFAKSHMPQIAGFFKGSKLADRILHPLSYLNSRNILRTVPGKAAEDLCHDINKKKQMSSLFKMLLKRQNSSNLRALEQKQIKCDHSDGSSQKKVRGRLRKAMSQFSCVSVEVEPDDDDETVGGSHLSPTESREDTQEGPKQEYQETFVKDMNQEYWIRTDSDYVVLEL